MLEDIRQQSLGRAHLLEVGDGVSDELDVADEAEAAGVEGDLGGGLGHHGVDGVVGDQQSVEFLDEADGLFTAQGVLDQALMGVLFVDHQFDLPALVVGADQVQSGSGVGVRVFSLGRGPA